MITNNGEEDNAFYDEKENRLIYSSGLDRADFTKMGYSEYSYEGNKYRVSQYKGWCSSIVRATYQFKNYIWLPDYVDPKESGLLNLDQIIEDNSLILGLDVGDFTDFSEINLGIICFDQKINGVLPFQSKYIYDAISNIKMTKMSKLK